MKLKWEATDTSCILCPKYLETAGLNTFKARKVKLAICSARDGGWNSVFRINFHQFPNPHAVSQPFFWEVGVLLMVWPKFVLTNFCKTEKDIFLHTECINAILNMHTHVS